LQPVYSVTLGSKLTERVEPGLAGYRGMGPVRVGNQAYEHIQNDVYGSVVMAATQMFFDRRLAQPGNVRIFERLESIGEQAIAVFDQPDAGLWEFRTIAKVHTFSAVMCWVACDRLAKISAQIDLPARVEYWRGHADEIHQVVCANAWNAELNSFVESFGDGDDVDASLLLLHDLGFLAADDPRFAGTVAAVENKLRRGDFLFRYISPDDFGVPETSFTICTFWFVDALVALGRTEEARALFENALSCRNHVGLLSEDLDPRSGELWGNFPQTYSMVGLISSAMRLSKSWEEAF
jgi:GH15 family glucan-1,4-alpha-glucosidase